jgi:hypothetical protein
MAATNRAAITRRAIVKKTAQINEHTAGPVENVAIAVI